MIQEFEHISNLHTTETIVNQTQYTNSRQLINTGMTSYET
jgi:hypothetical protein